MNWGDLKVGDVMHTNDEEIVFTSWLLLEREHKQNGVDTFKWLSLDDGAVITTHNFIAGKLDGYRLEPRT